MVLINCTGKIVIKDHEYCGDLGIDGAHCNRLLTKKPRDMTKEQWDEERFGMICSKADAFTDMQTAYESFCRLMPTACTTEVKQQMSTFFAGVKEVQNKAAEAKKRKRPAPTRPVKKN